MENNFDKSYRKQLESHKSSMDLDQFWNDLEPKLPKQKKRKYFLWWFILGLILIGISIAKIKYFNSEKNRQNIGMESPINISNSNDSIKQNTKPDSLVAKTPMNQNSDNKARQSKPDENNNMNSTHRENIQHQSWGPFAEGKDGIFENELLKTINSLIEYDDLVNNYFTPFVKSKFEIDKNDYKKDLKDLDKEQDRIKTAYIKGIVKINEFDKELKHIEFKRNLINQKILEQKQYENLNFTVDDLMIIKDKKTIENYIMPDKILMNISNYIMLPRIDKQKFISRYIDNIEVEKRENKISIINVNFREDLFVDLLNYHKEYKLPIDIHIFEDSNNNSIPIQVDGFKTKEEANLYKNKLKTFYNINYNEVEINEELEGSFNATSKDEKIIRLIPLKNEEKYKENKLKFGVISVNLAN